MQFFAQFHHTTPNPKKSELTVLGKKMDASKNEQEKREGEIKKQKRNSPRFNQQRGEKERAGGANIDCPQRKGQTDSFHSRLGHNYGGGEKRLKKKLVGGMILCGCWTVGDNRACNGMSLIGTWAEIKGWGGGGGGGGGGRGVGGRKEQDKTA